MSAFLVARGELGEEKADTLVRATLARMGFYDEPNQLSSSWVPSFEIEING